METPETMRAMVLESPREPLRAVEVPVPRPNPGQLLIRVHVCGVCRTDLHIVDGELPNPKLPLIPGHEIVGRVASLGEGAQRFNVGDRVGVPWLGYTDGTCRYCRSGRENLCENALFTGFNLDGGYAEYTVAFEKYCFAIPVEYGDAEAAPLLCAGLIGYRTYRMAGQDVERLGIYGFGAAGHIIAQVAVHEGKRSMPSPDQETSRGRNSPCDWAPCGQETRHSYRLTNWMPPSFSRPLALSFRRRCAPAIRGLSLSVEVFI